MSLSWEEEVILSQTEAKFSRHQVTLSSTQVRLLSKVTEAGISEQALFHPERVKNGLTLEATQELMRGAVARHNTCEATNSPIPFRFEIIKTKLEMFGLVGYRLHAKQTQNTTEARSDQGPVEDRGRRSSRRRRVRPCP